MNTVSDYWYEKKGIPSDERLRIKDSVKGESAGEFVICGVPHKLVRTDGQTFRDVFAADRPFLYKGDHTAPPDENDYSDAFNYLSDDGLAGFSVSRSGWLTSLYSNYDEPGFAGAVKKYVTALAYKLVCIAADTYKNNRLVSLYEREYGFRKYVTTVDDTEVMREYYGEEFIKAFTARNGTPFHVFMIGPDTVAANNDILHFEDYFEAEAYVEKTVKRM